MYKLGKGDGGEKQLQRLWTPDSSHGEDGWKWERLRVRGGLHRRVGGGGAAGGGQGDGAARKEIAWPACDGRAAKF